MVVVEIVRGEDKMDVYHENMRYTLYLCEQFVVNFFLF